MGFLIIAILVVIWPIHSLATWKRDMNRAKAFNQRVKTATPPTVKQLYKKDCKDLRLACKTKLWR